MPSKKTKVTAVPVENLPEEGLAKAWVSEQPAEAKTDAEHMTDVINEVKITDDTHILTTEWVEPETLTAARAKAKAAAKPRASRAKPKVEDAKPVLTSKVADVLLRSASSPVGDDQGEVVEVKPALEEVQAVIEVPKEEPKAPEVSEAKGASPLPVAAKQPKPRPSRAKPKLEVEMPEREPLKATRTQDAYPVEQFVEWEVQRRMVDRRNQRREAREKMLQNLVTSAF